MEPVRLNSVGLFLAGPCPDGPGYVSDEFLSFVLKLNLSFTLDERLQLENSVEVLPLEDEIHVSKSGPFDDFEGAIELHWLRDEKYAIQFVQVLHRGLGVGLDAGFGGPRVPREQDGHDAGEEVLIKIFRAQVPLSQENGRDVVSAQKWIYFSYNFICWLSIDLLDLISDDTVAYYWWNKLTVKDGLNVVL